MTDVGDAIEIDSSDMEIWAARHRWFNTLPILTRIIIGPDIDSRQF